MIANGAVLLLSNQLYVFKSCAISPLLSFKNVPAGFYRFYRIIVKRFQS